MEAFIAFFLAASYVTTSVTIPLDKESATEISKSKMSFSFSFKSASYIFLNMKYGKVWMTKSISRRELSQSRCGKKYFYMAYYPVGLFCNVIHSWTYFHSFESKNTNRDF